MRFLLASMLAACWTAPAAPPPVQPTPPPAPPQQPIAQDDSSDPCEGVEGGEEGGVEGGVVGGYVLAPPPPPPPPPPSAGAPRNVPPALLEGSRIAGEKNIVPDDPDKVQITRSGKGRLIGSWKLCVSDAGDVSEVKLLKSSGFPGYDRKLETEMWNWRYRPFLVNGKPVPVCTAITFIYSQDGGAPPPPFPTPPPPPPAP